MDTSKEGLGAVLSQKQADGQFHLVAYGSQVLTAHKNNYHSTKLVFLALNWAITEHFKEYLLYQPFLDGATIDASQRVEGENPAVIKGNQQKEKEV